MKILQINSVCGVGSTGRIVADLYNILMEQSHDCTIAFGRESAPKDIRTIRIGSNFGNNIHVLKSRLLDRHGFGSVRATRKVINDIDSYNPDIIHLHNIHGYYINVELLFRYFAKINKPVIWTLHDCWAFTGHCSHFDYIGCEKWKNRCYSCEQTKNYPKSLFYDNSKMNFNQKKELFTLIDKMHIVTPSNWLANLVKQSFLSVYPVTVINNGIDLDVFKPVDSRFRHMHSLNGRIIVLGVASNWSKKKGFDAFANLARQLKAPYSVVMVG